VVADQLDRLEPPNPSNLLNPQNRHLWNPANHRTNSYNT